MWACLSPDWGSAAQPHLGLEPYKGRPLPGSGQGLSSSCPDCPGRREHRACREASCEAVGTERVGWVREAGSHLRTPRTELHPEAPLPPPPPSHGVRLAGGSRGRDVCCKMRKSGSEDVSQWLLSLGGDLGQGTSGCPAGHTHPRAESRGPSRKRCAGRGG